MTYYRIPGRRASLLTRIIAAATGVVALVGLFLVGIVAWVLLAGAVFVGSIALAVALWRQRRRIDKFRRQHGDGFIEVEYEVVSERRERD